MLQGLSGNGRLISSSRPVSRSGLHRHGMPAPTQPPCPMGLSVCDLQRHPLPAHVGHRLVRTAHSVAELGGGFFANIPLSRV